jgi:PmbA protein
MTEVLSEDFATWIVAEAKAQGAGAADVIVNHRTEFSVSVRFGEVETLQESTDQGFGLRVLIDGKQGSVSGSDFDRSVVKSLIREAVEIAKATSADDSAGLPEAAELAGPLEDLDLFDEAIVRMSAEQKIELAIRAEQAAGATSPKIVNFDGGGFDTSIGTMILANSLGFVGKYRGTTCSLESVPVASDGDGMQRDYWYDVKRKLAELDSPEQIGQTAAKRTLRKLGGKAVSARSVPVVFEPTIAQDFLGDIFHAISGESIFRKSSFLVGQLGEKVAADCLSIVDNGRIPAGLGSRPFDGEGLPTRTTVVIRNGILENYLLNTYTARKLGLKSTANAARGLFGPPGVGVGNLCIEPGCYSLSDILKSVTDGFYITEMLGFGVNIVTGDYSRSASGLWIENGELTHAVQGVTVAGNLKEMLSGVEMVGNDLDFRGSIVSPTLLIGRMTVSA